MSAAGRIAATGLLVVLASLSDARALTCPRRIVFDLDPAGDFDDLSALWVAATSPELELVGAVVTSGAPEAGERSATRALSVVGREDVRILRGLTPIGPPPTLSYWSQFPPRGYEEFAEIERFGDGVSVVPDTQTGVDFYLDTALAPGAAVSVVTGSSLTTLAGALREADRRGVGKAFRAGVQCVLISGGDFRTAEWNVFADIPAAREVLASGIPIFQFGGEDEPKSRLHYPDRQRLWEAATPLTWSIQELYRLYHAGQDPTSPFLPILYDVHPLAYLIEGEKAFRFRPLAVTVDDTGHLVSGPGSPNVMSRVPTPGNDLVDWIVPRLAVRIPPAEAHLRAIREASGSGAPTVLGTALDAAQAAIEGGGPIDPGAVQARLAAVREQLSGLGDRAPSAQRHLDLARQFLLGDPRPDAWRDPYTDRYIRLKLVWMRLPRLPKRKLAAALVTVGAALWIAAWLRRRRREASGVA